MDILVWCQDTVGKAPFLNKSGLLNKDLPGQSEYINNNKTQRWSLMTLGMTLKENENIFTLQFFYIEKNF